MGSIEQARSLIDALGGSADYVDDYIAYTEVGDMEKLGNEVNDLFEPANGGTIALGAPREFKPGYGYGDMFPLDDEAYSLARSKTDSYLGSDDYNLDRFEKNRNRHLHPDDFLSEHKITDMPDSISLPAGAMDMFGDESSKPMPGSSYSPPISAPSAPVIPNLPPGEKGKVFLKRINDLASSLETYEMADELAKTFGYTGSSYSFDLYPDLIDRNTPERNRVLNRMHDIT